MLIKCRYARVHRLGFLGLEADDYLMIVAGVSTCRELFYHLADRFEALYTILIVCLNVISGGGGSNLFPPEQFSTFTPADIQDRIKGSKIVLVSEQVLSICAAINSIRLTQLQAMLNVIYTIKACMLIMYTRLTTSLPHRRLVLYLSIYVACGWLGTQIAFFTACRPFKGYWAMPPPNPQCTTLQNYAIIQGCFNISSDLLMLSIPLPMLVKLKLPWKQKGVLIAIFSLGLFVVTAAILTKVFNLSNIYDPEYMLWYTRESSVAIYVSNLPLIWPLMREWFPALGTITPGQKKTSSKKVLSHSDGNTRTNTNSVFAKKSENGVITIIQGPGESAENLHNVDMELEERQDWDADSWGSDGDGQGGIQKSVTVRISEERLEGSGKTELAQIPKKASSGEKDLESGVRAMPPGFTWRPGGVKHTKE
jgi:hypothetical protein